MSEGKGKTGVLLPMVLIGAVILSGVGLLGLLLQATNVNDIENSVFEPETGSRNGEMDRATMIAETQFEDSFEQAEIAKANAPSERNMDLDMEFEAPVVPVDLPDDGNEVTRSNDDDLLSGEGFIQKTTSPGAPEVDLDDTFSLIDGYDGVLVSAYEGVKNEEAPGTLPMVEIDENVDLPVDEDGANMDKENIGDISDDLDGTSKDIDDLLGDHSPDAYTAGLDEMDLQGEVWDMRNLTETDTDGDGNPEWIYEIRISHGSVNKTLVNGTLDYIVGYEYEYMDADSDGVPNFERTVWISMANFTSNGKMLAQGISFSEVLVNDTDGNGIIDRMEIRHLSYGYHGTIFGTVRSYAIAGELLMDDGDEDGIFEDKEATKVFFFKHEMTNTNVTLRESFVIIHGKEKDDEKELSSISFNRHNNTLGKTILEEALIWSYSEDDDSKNLVVIAGKNNTVTNRLQYVVLNASELVDGNETTKKVTAFAVDNSTLLFGGTRSDAVALDLESTVSGSSKVEKGFLAAARTDIRANRLDEGFFLISVEREFDDDILIDENSTIIAGKNVTTTGLNSTMAFAQKLYTDADGDGNPEYLRESWAIGRNEDHDKDGIVNRESYAVHWNEIRDADSDGNPEWNQTFNMLGIKVDSNDDGNVDRERGLMSNVTVYDANSNGFFELKETGIVGFDKIDEDLDGSFDTERYAGFWEKITDVNDDGTTINTQSGTWTQ